MAGAHRGYSANISCSRPRTWRTVGVSSGPRTFWIRSTSTVRSWSRATYPTRRWKRHVGRQGYAWPPVVIGATIAVLRWPFSSSGDTTTQGRVFLMSLPSVGSRRTRHTCPRRTVRGATAIPSPFARMTSTWAGRALVVVSRPHPRGFGSPSAPRSVNALHYQATWLGVELDFIGQPGGLEQRLGNANTAGVPDLDDARPGDHCDYIVSTSPKAAKTAQATAAAAGSCRRPPAAASRTRRCSRTRR